MKTLMAMLLVVLIGVIPATADIDEQAGTSGGRFFKVNFGARPMAMGGAYTAEKGLYAIQWNPAAGAHRIRSTQLAAQQTDLLLDFKAQYLGLGSQRIGSMTVNGFGAFFDKGTFRRTTEVSGGAFGGFDGTFDASDWQVGLNLAGSLDKQLDVGLNVKFLRSRIESFEASAMAMDAGFQYAIDEQYQVGASVENLGQDIKFVNQSDPLPLTFNAGVRGRWVLSENFGYQANVDLRQPRDDKLGMRVGNELSVYKYFAFRVGYSSSSDLSDGFSYGAGFQVYGVQLDYAYVPSGDFFDRRQNFSLTLTF